MRKFDARVIETHLDESGQVGAWIECPSTAIPAAGQYVRTYLPGSYDMPLAANLFAGAANGARFYAVPPIPHSWQPGTVIRLTGPHGRGFRTPAGSRRLALVALGNTTGRLMPLVKEALASDTAVALFSQAPLPELPASVEAHPLAAVQEALSWADFFAIDVPLDDLPALRTALGLEPQAKLSCPAQVLVFSHMPCGGLADCGCCSVQSRRSWLQVCTDGPVFDLNELDW